MYDAIIEHLERDMNVHGACHCGRVSFEATIDPARMSICHCTDCQILTGSPFRVTVLTSRDDIHLTGAEPAVYVKTGDNGGRRVQHFCSTCGSPVFTSGDDESGGEWGIRWGSIRERAALRPARQIWCRSAVPWLDEVAGLPARPAD
jgi:hypothetical protein